MDIKTFIIAILTIWITIPCCAQKHQQGKASYYSKRATGARTASGQKIHHDSLVCAHRYYPFGTHLKVTNLSNGKSVVVKVIDRGPFGRGRIIDLSWGAAKELDMLSQGVGTVKIEMIDHSAIPYRPEETKLPKIDFEMAEFEPENKIIGKEKEEKKVKTEKKKRRDNSRLFLFYFLVWMLNSLTLDMALPSWMTLTQNLA